MYSILLKLALYPYGIVANAKYFLLIKKNYVSLQQDFKTKTICRILT